MEKWLVQVETMMIQSMKDTTSEALRSLANSSRSDWIISWPGQVFISNNKNRKFLTLIFVIKIVQCVNCIQWTTDVTEAIMNKRLPEQVKVCTQQIEESVKMIQGKLQPGHQITVEALIVIDVHGW